MINNKTEVVLQEALHKQAIKKIKIDGYFNNPRFGVIRYIENFFNKIPA